MFHDQRQARQVKHFKLSTVKLNDVAYEYSVFEKLQGWKLAQKKSFLSEKIWTLKCKIDKASE